ncbi:hypothetical protein CAN33_0042815 [Aspergillus niger]|uniref:Uncharacterized protein n=1 Tax=Aspergillus niger TaxID=5061 RepID=A0A254TRR2_ASPNG|nr:hypothetical protein CBS147345_6038 [Aspergillus niger]TPR02140.1 hypothetical protein CAN33_0042815 [Aspergillus niger]SPB52621.1 unnamed protein product [Aspergillus niger]
MSPSQVAPQQPDDIPPLLPPNEKSQYRMIKEAELNNMHDFMLSHGLNAYYFEDYGEVNPTIDTMRRYDQEYWEAEQQERYQEHYEDQEAGHCEPSPGYCEYWGTELAGQKCEVWEEGPSQSYHDQYEGYEGDQSHHDCEDCEVGTV